MWCHLASILASMRKALKVQWLHSLWVVSSSGRTLSPKKQKTIFQIFLTLSKVHVWEWIHTRFYISHIAVASLIVPAHLSPSPKCQFVLAAPVLMFIQSHCRHSQHSFFPYLESALWNRRRYTIVLRLSITHPWLSALWRNSPCKIC